MRLRAIGGLAAAALLAGCGANGEAAPAATVTVTSEVTVSASAEAAPAATETVTVTATPTSAETSAAPVAPEATESGALALGDTFEGPADATLQVTDVRIVEEYGFVTTGAKVTSCNNGTEPVGFSSEVWLGTDADGGRYSPTPATSGELKPAYPSSTFDQASETAPGECLTGWILFDTDNLVELRYRSQVNGSAAWTLPAQG